LSLAVDFFQIQARLGHRVAGNACAKRIVVAGGGVIGLSLTWELARRGHHVTLLERDQTGRQASWAGAGILSPASAKTACHALEKLAALSNELHPQWFAELTLLAVDNGYRRCGGVYIARSRGEQAALIGLRSYWNQYEIEHRRLTVADLKNRIPLLDTTRVIDAVWVPDEAQIRNPAHLKALVVGCHQAGAKILSDCGSLNIETSEGSIYRIVTERGTFQADVFCFAVGAWSEILLKQIDVSLPIIPVRGQMLLFKLPRQPFAPIVTEGSRYIVPRDDGHVLVGSTTEEAGFDTGTTDEAVAELQLFASDLVPDLDESSRVQTWAGLRPASFDGLPCIGRVPNFHNAFVATGHFKTGLQLSTGTAVIVADLVEGRSPPFDLSALDPARLNRRPPPRWSSVPAV
jgi:glycine oxidase